MKEKFNNLKEMIFNNKSIIENYFFMTMLTALNSLFALIIYPYLIRTLEAEQYGKYVYMSSIVGYFTSFVSFGFDLIALKKITENRESIEKKSEVVSSVFTAKLYLQLIVIIVYSGMVVLVPSFRENYLLYFCMFLNTFISILLPTWYFQAIQKMKVVTYIQLFCKLLSLPFIFLFVKSTNDLFIFIVIYTLTNILGGVIAIIILIHNEKIKIRFIVFSRLKEYYKDAFPLFLTGFIGTLKEQGAIIIIGNFFGMREVAIYDLAMKIISIPRLLFTNINAAIFPKLLLNLTKDKVKKIIQYEYFIGGAMMSLVIILGYWAVVWLGGIEMSGAYTLLIAISPTIITWLVVGAYIYFVFLPNGLNYLITKNQMLAMVSFFVFSAMGILFSDRIIMLCIAMTLSGILEIAYCIYITEKKKLL